MRLLAPIQFIVTCLLLLLIVGCGDSSDSAFPKPSCGSADDPCVEIIAFTISPANKTILVNYGQQYSATVFFDDGSQQDVTEQTTWSLDNTNVASISNDVSDIGLAHGIAPGSTLINASYKTATASAKLTVMDEPVEQLIIVPASTLLPVGTSQQFAAYLLLTNKQSINVTEHVTWQMADNSIASIDNNALVIALSQGSSELNASITHNDEPLLTATAEVTVVASAIKEILITPANGTFPIGTTGVYQASAHYTDGHVIDVTKDASWSIADSNIGSITESGEFAGTGSALSLGTTQILASLEGVTGSTPATVTDAVIRSISINPVAAVVPAGVKVLYQAHALYSDDSVRNITRLAAWSSSVPEIGNVQFVSALAGVANTFSPGITQISAHFNGLAETVPLTVTDAITESLQISPTNPSVPLGTSGQFTAIAYYSDGASHDVTEDTSWRSTDHSIATIIPNGEEAGFSNSIKVGNTDIIASFADEQAQTVLTVTQETLTSLSLTPAKATVPAGAQQSYQLFGLYSDGSSRDLTNNASWQSSNSDLATIDNQGRASTLKAGEVTIIATYQGMTNNAQLTITAAQLTHITVTPTTLAVAVGHQAEFSAIAYYSDFTSHNISDIAIWSSDDNTVAKVNIGSNGGLTTGMSVGSATITASFDNQTASGTIKVTDAVLESVSITPITATIAAGLQQQYQLMAVFSDSSKQDVSHKAHWQSSDLTVATINTSGLATSSLQGETTIKGSYQGFSAPATLSVTEATLDTLQITPQNPIEPLGTTGQFTAIAYYSNNTTADVSQEVTWSSDNEGTVSIITTGATGGYASADQVGETDITANLNGTAVSTSATVTEATLDSLSLTPANSAIPSGTAQQYQLFALFSDSSSKEVTLEANWQSSDTSIANFVTSGEATGISAGEVTVTANYKGMQATSSLTVTDATVTFITVTPATQELAINHSARLNAVAYYSDLTSKNISYLANWAIDDDAIASVDNTLINGGTVTGLTAGIATITATFSGQSATNATTVTAVTLTGVTISPIDDTVAGGLTKQYHLFALFSDGSSNEVTDESSWQSSNANTVSIDTLGLATSYSEGKVAITGTYQGLSASTSLTVTGAMITSLEISPANPSVPVGTQDKFTAKVFYSDGGSADASLISTWSSSNTAIVSIVTNGTSAGQASADKVGSSKITASYKGMQATTTATVTAAVLESIVINNTQASITLGDNTNYVAIAFYSDGSFKNIPNDAVWESSNTAVATVFDSGGSHGTAISIAVGNSNITVTSGLITSNTALLTVTDALMTSIQVTPANITVPLSTQDTFTAIAYYSNGTNKDITKDATWQSDDADIVSVVTTGENAGLAKALTSGTTHVSAQLLGIVSNAAKVIVTEKTLDNIQITPNNITLAKGSSQQYKVSAIYTDYSVKDITAFTQIRSLDNSIATFDNRNIANAIDIGDVELTTVYLGMKSEREFLHVVAPTVTTIKITPSVALLNLGDKQSYLALASFSDGSSQDISLDAHWISTNDDIAIGYIQDDQAIAEATTAGSTDITAKFQGIVSNAANLTVTPFSGSGNPIVSLSITPQNETLNTGSSLQYNAFAHFKDDSIEALEQVDSWLSSDTSSATISPQGLATAIAFGSSTITANYNGLSATSSLNIDGDCGNKKPDSIYIVPGDTTLSLATELQYQLWGIWSSGCEMRLTKNNANNWSSGNTAVVSIDKKDGLALAKKVGATTIHADYQSLTATPVNITVTGEEVLSVSIQPAPSATINKNGSQTYLCSARTVIDGTEQPERFVTGEASFTSSQTKIAVIGANDGTLQTVNAKNKTGNSTITCHFGGKSASSSLTVQ